MTKLVLENKILAFKEHVIKLASNKTFVHNTWFVKYHLEIVESIAKELCEKYKEADSDLVMTLVWLHDYGKMIDFENQYKETLEKGKLKLIELNFPESFIDKAIKYVEKMDKKMSIDLNNAEIEIKIISSADAASHMIGPFFHLWWLENSTKPYLQLMQDNLQKINKDWNKKIVLPEVRKAFENRYKIILEQCGNIPNKFF